MRSHNLLSTLAVISAAACSTDEPTAAVDHQLRPSFSSSQERVAICHESGWGAGYLEVAQPALKGHLGHGDYVTTLVVSHDAAQTGNGVHFVRIGDALGAARAGRLDRGELAEAACRITIAVAAGVYNGTVTGQPFDDIDRFPLIVDVPDITLRGALVMGLDEAGRATGDATGGVATTLRPVEPLPNIAGSQTPIIIANAHPGGSAGNGLSVEGFVFESGHAPPASHGGIGVLSMRVVGLTIRGNRFSAFLDGVDLRAGNADVAQNLFATNDDCDICLAGPGRFSATGNRILESGIAGIIAGTVISLPLPSAVEPYALAATSETWAEIRNNEVRDHRRIPVGVGIRLDALGVGAPNVHGVVHAVIQDNLLVNNRFGMMLHAGFPVAGTDRTSNVNVTLGDNVIQQSCQAKLLVALSRHQTALGLNANTSLLNSTYQLSLGGHVDWNDVWFAHAAGFGNTLIVDGQTIANGSRQFYSAAGCPGL